MINAIINVIGVRIFASLLVLCTWYCTANQTASEVHLRGVVMPAQKVKLSFAQPGIVRQLASGGSLVKTGEVIAKLDDKKAKAQLEQSKAQYRSAQSELAAVKHSREKSARLVEEGVLSDIALVEADFTVAVANEKVAVAKAQWGMAETTLAECVVFAPFDGAVVAVNVNQGEWLNAGDPFIEFVNFSQLTLSIDILPEMAIGLIAGLTTAVLDNDKVVGQATVKTVFPVIDPASGLRRVIWTVVANGDELLSGRYVSLAKWPSSADVTSADMTGAMDVVLQKEAQ